MAYEFWLSSEASRSLLGSDDLVRRKMETALRSLAAHPFVKSDFQERGPSGRVYEVICHGDVILTYWPDHATKEVRVICCEIV